MDIYIFRGPCLIHEELHRADYSKMKKSNNMFCSCLITNNGVDEEILPLKTMTSHRTKRLVVLQDPRHSNT